MENHFYRFIIIAKLNKHDKIILSVDDFVACDNNLETCENTTAKLESQILDECLEQRYRILSKSDDKKNCLKKMKPVLILKKC